MSVTVRRGRPGDRPAVMTILDGAMLETNPERIRDALCESPSPTDVLVATCEKRVLGVIVVDGYEISGIGVRRRRRNQGIGRTLVEAAATGRTELTAEFDRSALPFYRALGFSVERIHGDRFRGTLISDPV